MTSRSSYHPSCLEDDKGLSDVKPALYFPSYYESNNQHLERLGQYDASSQCFPQSFRELGEYRNTYCDAINNTGYPPAIPEFINALNKAYDIILFSGEITVNVLERILKDFELCSKKYDVQPHHLQIVSAHSDLRDYRNGKMIMNVPVGVQLDFATRLEDVKKVHDRFAILDDYIWHFGAGIGGMHPSFHAISGPWIDINNSFRTFCKQFF